MRKASGEVESGVLWCARLRATWVLARCGARVLARCGAQRFERRGSAERWARSILLEIVRGGDLRLRSLRSFSTL